MHQMSKKNVILTKHHFLWLVCGVLSTDISNAVTASRQRTELQLLRGIGWLGRGGKAVCHFASASRLRRWCGLTAFEIRMLNTTRCTLASALWAQMDHHRLFHSYILGPSEYMNHFSRKSKKMKYTLIFPYRENIQCHDSRPFLSVK